MKKGKILNVTFHSTGEIIHDCTRLCQLHCATTNLLLRTKHFENSL